MAKKKILIVDDDPGILSMLKLMLRLEGYEAVVCEEALNVLDKIVSEDEERGGLDEVQKMTNTFVGKIDELAKHKEQDIMSV